MKQITIYLHLEEQIDDTLVASWKPPVNRAETPEHKAFAELLGFGKDEQGVQLDKEVIFRLGSGIGLQGDGGKEFTVKKAGALSYRLTRKIKQPRETYQFPKGSFGYDSTKWGPTDFYDEDRATIDAAFRSRLDFVTPWLSCKKEILSSRIIRSKNQVVVEVSVSDDFDTDGTGEASFKVSRATTVERFFEKLETAGGEAHSAADDSRKDNQVFFGYSVGKVRPDGKNDWEFTYLVSTGGFDVPPGDNYFRWGWQEVDDKVEDFDIDAHPEEIPADVAAKLAEGIQNYETTVRAGDWQATIWKD